MNSERRSTRRREREGTSIPGKADFFLAGVRTTENILIINVTLQGAGVLLSSSLQVGQMIKFEFAMPREFRCYDVGARVYEIWGVVRYVGPVPTGVIAAHPELDLTDHYEVGVAFSGKFPPPEYLANPDTLFDIKPMPRRDGLWALRRAPRIPDW